MRSTILFVALALVILMLISSLVLAMVPQATGKLLLYEIYEVEDVRYVLVTALVFNDTTVFLEMRFDGGFTDRAIITYNPASKTLTLLVTTSCEEWGFTDSSSEVVVPYFILLVPVLPKSFVKALPRLDSANIVCKMLGSSQSKAYKLGFEEEANYTISVKQTKYMGYKVVETKTTKPQKGPEGQVFLDIFTSYYRPDGVLLGWYETLRHGSTEDKMFHMTLLAEDDVGKKGGKSTPQLSSFTTNSIVKASSIMNKEKSLPAVQTAIPSTSTIHTSKISSGNIVTYIVVGIALMTVAGLYIFMQRRQDQSIR